MIYSFFAKIGTQIAIAVILAAIIGGMAWKIRHQGDVIALKDGLVEASKKEVEREKEKYVASQAEVKKANDTISRYIKNELENSKQLEQHRAKERELSKKVQEFRARERNEKTPNPIPPSCTDACTDAYGSVIRAFQWVHRNQQADSDGDGDDFGGSDPAGPVVSGGAPGSGG